MPLVTIHYHTKEGEKLNLGKTSKKLAEDFEKSKVDYLILTDKAFACEKIDLPIKAFKEIKSYLKAKKENLLFGLEFLTFDNYHILGLCLTPERWENKISPKNLEDVCKSIERDEGFIVVPHQFGPCGLGKRADEIIKLYEKGEICHKPFIEVSYYLESIPSLKKGLKKANKEAINYARKNNLALISGLDSRFKSFDLAFNFFKEDIRKCLEKASLQGFNNNYIIPYITPSHTLMLRETIYLLRDHTTGFLRTGKFEIASYFLGQIVKS
ncbi:MAG: hypothetical protein QXD54_02530 [Candidatus Aenigmatarchaeota archaeon]